MAISKNKQRITSSIDKDKVKEIDLLAKERNMTRSQWFNWAIEQAISAQRGQYGLSGLEAQRLNQLQQSVVEMTGSLDNLSEIVIGLVKMMNVLMSGDSYLNDEDGSDMNE